MNISGGPTKGKYWNSTRSARKIIKKRPVKRRGAPAKNEVIFDFSQVLEGLPVVMRLSIWKKVNTLHVTEILLETLKLTNYLPISTC